jgi:hypothetical protein
MYIIKKKLIWFTTNTQRGPYQKQYTRGRDVACPWVWPLQVVPCEEKTRNARRYSISLYYILIFFGDYQVFP